MRVVKEIPHHTFKITVFTVNAKFLIKIEWGSLEQCFKIPEIDLLGGVNDIEKMLTDEFLRNCMIRFHQMQTEFTTALKTI